MKPPQNILGGNTLSVYLESNGLLWAWGRDAVILGTLLRLPIRHAQNKSVVTKFICFRYRGNIDELQDGLNRILPQNVAILR